MSAPLHILVVDDDPEVAAWLKEFLESLGHRTETASSGIEALNFINAAVRANDRYQFLLLDVHLPLLDGLGVVRELRRAKDYTDVALFTGNHALLPQLDVEAQRNGCLMVLPKPLDTAQLTQLVEFAAMRQGRQIGGAAAAPRTQTGSYAPPPAGQTGRVARPEPQRGYDPFQEPAPATNHETSDYMPTASPHAHLPPPPDSQVARNERRTQQYYSTDQGQPGIAQPPQRTPLPAPPGARTPLPPPPGGRTPLPGNPVTRTPLPPAARTPQPAAPQRPPAYPPQPSPPPVQPPQRRSEDQRTAQPPPYDPRQAQGLPPVPAAPVAQPTRRDSRLSSGSLPPIPQAPVDPRTASRVGGLSIPQAPLDPRTSSRVGGLPPVPQAPADPRTSTRLGGAPPKPASERAADPRRTTSSLQPPAPPRRATPLDEPDDGTAGGYSPHTAPQRNPAAEPDSAQSSRLRRSIGGTGGQQPPSAESTGMERSRLVACAYCRGSFRAVLKPQPYNLVCVHCGQLNRIDP